MSDVDVVYEAVEAFNRRDIEGVIAVVHPDVVWEEGDVIFPDLPPAYHGHDALRRWYQEAVVDAWSSFEAELLDLRDEGGGRIVQDYRVKGRGRKSGIDVDMKVVQTFIVRDGKIARRMIERA
jgi:ketosteroid isomerase-like protein